MVVQKGENTPISFGLTEALMTPDLSSRGISERIRRVYDFAVNTYRERTGQSEARLALDIGTYTGLPGLPILSQIARRIITVDCDPTKQMRASNRVEIKSIGDRIIFIQAYAQDILKMEEAFSTSSVDLAVMVEVLGAGFEGSTEDLGRIFEGVYRVINKDSGLFIFTVRSPYATEMINEQVKQTGLNLNISDLKGVPVSKRRLKSLLGHYFYVDWYGQMIGIRDAPQSRNLALPIRVILDQVTGRVHFEWTADSFTPKKIDSETEVPLFLIGVCRPKRAV